MFAVWYFKVVSPYLSIALLSYWEGCWWHFKCLIKGLFCWFFWPGKVNLFTLGNALMELWLTLLDPFPLSITVIFCLILIYLSLMQIQSIKMELILPNSRLGNVWRLVQMLPVIFSLIINYLSLKQIQSIAMELTDLT